MKHLRNFTIGMTLGLLLFTQTASVPTASAQTGDVSGSGGAVYCRNGGRDYGNFLSAVISYDGFVEYWKDILVRYSANMCLYMDIDSLLNRIDKTRKQIRNAFYTCDGTAPKLAQTYYQLEAELYFLRKYVNATNGQVIFVSTASVSKDFIDYFVNQKGFFTSRADAQKLLDQLFAKYKGKQDTYVNCADPTWDNIIQKWNEFKSTAGGLSAVKDAAESIKKSWDNAINTPFKRTGNLLGGLLDAKLNGLDPATAWGDMSAVIEQNMPKIAQTTSGQANSANQQASLGFTYDQFLQAAASDSSLHNQELQRTQFLAQYQQLYQQGTASIEKEILDRLDYLDKSINATFEFIDQTAQCTKGIVNKMCS